MSILPPAKRLDGLKKLSQVSKANKLENSKPDHVLIESLTKEASKILSTTPSDSVHGPYAPYRYVEVEYQDKNGVVISQGFEVVVHTAYGKLFEGTRIIDSSDEIARYIFGNILGYDSYYQCPVIVIRDGKNRVVDLIRYRPTAPNGYELPKYFQKKSIDKPLNRGKYFLYPFQIEIKRLIEKNSFVFFGEGLKNALNALINSVPFVSIESTSNAENPKLIEYIDDLYRKGIKVYGALDGDAAGKDAFIKINKKLKHKIINTIDFDSGVDFTEYMKKDSK